LVGVSVNITGSGFTGATGVSFNGTPAVTFTVNSNTSITATVPVGATTGNVTVFVGACSGTSTTPFTVDVPSFTTFNVTAFIEGYYIGASEMTSALVNSGIGVDPLESDTIIVNLYDPMSTTTVVESDTIVIATDGTASATFSPAIAGNSYYVAIQHRNAVLTYTALPLTFTSTTSYDFTTDATQAYGDNMKDNGDGTWSMFSADINQDGYVDIVDYPLFEADQLGLASGYIVTDINGDGYTDIVDYPIFEANQLNLISVVIP
jgi:hypothetical protein